jgi:Uma2 family endonuclease
VVREPDLLVLPPEEVPKAKGVPLLVRPALVVEVMSPATQKIELVEKAEDYASAGVPEYWVVGRERKEVLVHRLEKGSYMVKHVASGKGKDRGGVESRSVLGFWLEALWLFREPLPAVAECLRGLLEQS